MREKNCRIRTRRKLCLRQAISDSFLTTADQGVPVVRRTVTSKDPKPTAERIEPLAERVLIGDVIILPEFQRPLVWKRKQILELVDSIYRNYPIGSMLLWEFHTEAC